jgi:hypothetical protein
LGRTGLSRKELERVERAHGTHQDRLVKKLRLAEIVNYDQANACLGRALLGRPALRATGGGASRLSPVWYDKPVYSR